MYRIIVYCGFFDTSRYRQVFISCHLNLFKVAKIYIIFKAYK